MSGTPALRMYSSRARASKVASGPMMTLTFSRSMSSCVRVFASAGCPPVSATMRTALRPASMLLRCLRRRLIPSSICRPPAASGPVRTLRNPIRIGSLCAEALVERQATAAIASQKWARRIMARQTTRCLPPPEGSVEPLLSRRVPVPVERPAVGIDHHRLHVEVLVEGLGAELAADSGVLHAAPGKGGIEAVMVVHPDDSAAEFRRHPMGAGDVAGADRRREPERGGVGYADALLLVVERHHHGEGPEDLLPGDPPRGGHGPEDGRLDENPVREPRIRELRNVSSGDQLRLLREPRLDVCEDALLLLGGDHRTELRRRLGRVA